jgi:glutamate N-acetyltransferase/amino-acid N-acetyltransferase
MSVVGPKGFIASGVAAGLKASGGLDVALVVNQGPNNAVAAVFTTNRCLANPILWSKQVIAGGQARAIVLNSGGANCYTGAQGFQTTHATAEKVAELTGFPAAEIVVCSTGLIGS